MSNSVTQQVHLIDKVYHALSTAVDQKIVGDASFCKSFFKRLILYQRTIARQPSPVYQVFMEPLSGCVRNPYPKDRE
jgi:hypothetical protein